MSALVLENKDELKTLLNAWCDDAEETAKNVARGAIAYVFNHIVEHGPQYSGDFVANINLSIGTPDYSFEEFNPKILGRDNRSVPRGGVKRENDGQAVAHAKLMAEPTLARFKLGDTAYIASGANHGSGGYAVKIELGTINFRPENPSGGATFSKALAATVSANSTMTPDVVQRLSRLRILGGTLW